VGSRNRDSEEVLDEFEWSDANSGRDLVEKGKGVESHDDD
jgi:hypothetical protein